MKFKFFQGQPTLKAVFFSVKTALRRKVNKPENKKGSGVKPYQNRGRGTQIRIRFEYLDFHD